MASPHAWTMSLTWTKSRCWQPVFVDQRRLAREHAAREDRRDAGVRVRERLARAVDVEEAQRHGRQVVGVAEGQRHLLVVALVDGVDRRRIERLVLVGRARPQDARRSAGSASPSRPLASCCDRPQAGRDAAARGAGVGAFAVDRHRRRHQQLAHAAGCVRRPGPRAAWPCPCALTSV